MGQLRPCWEYKGLNIALRRKVRICIALRYAWCQQLDTQATGAKDSERCLCLITTRKKALAIPAQVNAYASLSLGLSAMSA